MSRLSQVKSKDGYENAILEEIHITITVPHAAPFPFLGLSPAYLARSRLSPVVLGKSQRPLPRQRIRKFRGGPHFGRMTTTPLKQEKPMQSFPHAPDT